MLDAICLKRCLSSTTDVTRALQSYDAATRPHRFDVVGRSVAAMEMLKTGTPFRTPLARPAVGVSYVNPANVSQSPNDDDPPDLEIEPPTDSDDDDREGGLSDSEDDAIVLDIAA